MVTPRIIIFVLLVFNALTLSAGEKLLRGLGPEPDSLDIHLAQGVAALNVLRDLREGLMTLDVSGQPVFGAAQAMQLEAEGLRVIFTLRPELRWSDGTALTAADFVRGWQRAVTPATAASNAVLLDAIENAREIRFGKLSVDKLGIRALDAQTLEIRLSRQLPWLSWLLSHPLTYPIAAGEQRQRLGPFNGAYTLQSWVPNDRLVLQRNPYFHSHESVAIEQLDYLPIPNPNTELNLYRAGNLHITETIPPARYKWLMENYPGQLQISPYLGTFFLGLNLRKPPLANNPDLRRALSMAIDRDKLTQLVLASGEKSANSLVPPGIAGYSTATFEIDARSQAEREQQAKKLYQAAGYSTKKPLRLELRINSSATHRRMALAVAAMWKQNLGVITQIVNEEWKVFVNNRRQGVVTEVFRGGWIGDYPDPTTFLSLFVSDNVQNWSAYNSPRYDNLLALAATESDPDLRHQILQRAEQQLLNDMPMIPLYYYVSRHLVNPRVSGYMANTLDIHLSRYLNLQAAP